MRELAAEEEAELARRASRPYVAVAILGNPEVVQFLEAVVSWAFVGLVAKEESPCPGEGFASVAFVQAVEFDRVEVADCLPSSMALTAEYLAARSILAAVEAAASHLVVVACSLAAVAIACSCRSCYSLPPDSMGAEPYLAVASSGPLASFVVVDVPELPSRHEESVVCKSNPGEKKKKSMFVLVILLRRFRVSRFL